jgi:hypothetical protein
VVSGLDPAESERFVGCAVEDAWKRGGDSLPEADIRWLLGKDGRPY